MAAKPRDRAELDRVGLFVDEDPEEKFIAVDAQLGHDFGLRPGSGLALGAVLCMVRQPCAGIPARSIAATALDDIPARPPQWPFPLKDGRTDQTERISRCRSPPSARPRSSRNMRRNQAIQTCSLLIGLSELLQEEFSRKGAKTQSLRFLCVFLCAFAPLRENSPWNPDPQLIAVPDRPQTI